MAILKENELSLFNDLILKMYDINDIMGLQTTFLNYIKVIIPYEQGNFLIFNPETRREILEKTVLFNVSESMITILYDSLDCDDNYLRNLFDAPNSIVYVDSDMLGEEIWKKTNFYKNYLLPEKIPYSCGMVIIEEGDLLGVVNLCRSERWGVFTEKELYLMGLLKDHISKHLHRCYKSGLYTNSQKNVFLNNLSSYKLTPREFEIVKLIIDGYTNDEIAEKLFISISTAKKHINSIYSKFHINNRMGLIRMFNTK